MPRKLKKNPNRLPNFLNMLEDTDNTIYQQVVTLFKINLL